MVTIDITTDNHGDHAHDEFMTQGMHEIEKEVQDYDRSLHSDSEHRNSFHGDGFLSYSGPQEDACSDQDSAKPSASPSGTVLNSLY